MRWLDRQLAEAHDRSGSPVVVVDPDGLLDDATAGALGELWRAVDYLSLRRLWEEHGRRAPLSPRQVFVVCSAEFTEARSLPWDIERGATVVVIRWPVGPEWRTIARQLPPALFDLLADLAVPGTSPEAVVVELLCEGLGVVLPAPSASSELEAVVRLIASHLVPDPLWVLVRPLVRDVLALGLCQPTPDLAPLQGAWAQWLSLGDRATHAATLRDAGAGLGALFASGLLRPEPLTADGLPAWSRLGATQPGPAERMADLLDAPPRPWPPKTAADWVAAASWWGDVRAAAAAASPAPAALVNRALETWEELDEAFQLWLRSGYSLLFSSTRSHPITLDQVAPFLARRHGATGRRQLLVLVDGMGFAQWSQLRRALAVEVVDATGCFAMCPTLTSVSRQAVFAGAVPLAFANSLWTTSREEARWRAFWGNEGLSGREVGYHRTAGATAANLPVLSGEAVAGVVLLAVDELMHGSDVLGDAQLSAGLEAWVRHGFLDTLVKRADGEGFEVWMTADHGNIEATPSGRVMEGPLVDQAGTRVRLYENTVLRDTARADGVSWDPPGLPEGKAPLFAAGRTGYHSGGPRVSHGGLSLDEVIVPFVQVVPR